MTRPNSMCSVSAHVACRASMNRVVMFGMCPLRGPMASERNRFVRTLPYEFQGQLARHVIGKLLWRRFHEITARPGDGAADAAIEREFRAAHRVDHDTRRVRRVPHLELELDVQGRAAERGAFHADVGPLAVGEPLDVVARPDMNAIRRYVDLAR